jgi:hypothetical protein
VADVVLRSLVERVSLRVDSVLPESDGAAVSGAADDGPNTRPTDVPGCPSTDEPFTNSIPVTTSMPRRKISAVAPAHRAQYRGGRGRGLGGVSSESGGSPAWGPVFSRALIRSRVVLSELS